MMDNLLVYVLLLSGIAIGWLLGYRFAKNQQSTQTSPIAYPTTMKPPTNQHNPRLKTPLYPHPLLKKKK